MDVLSTGFGLPLYLTEIPEMAEIRASFEGALKGLYGGIERFMSTFKDVVDKDSDHGPVLRRLLPLAHRVELRMHGDPKQGFYMPHLRWRPGGHINYTTQAWDAATHLARSDPYLSGLVPDGARPDPTSRDLFFDRS